MSRPDMTLHYPPASPSKLCNPTIPTRPKINPSNLIIAINKFQRANRLPPCFFARMLTMIMNLFYSPPSPNIANPNRCARRPILRCSQKPQSGMHIYIQLQLIPIRMRKREQRLRPVFECLMIEFPPLCRVAITRIESLEVLLVVVMVLVIEYFAWRVS